MAQPLHQVGVAREPPAEKQRVVIAPLQDAPRVGVVEPAGGEEGGVAEDAAERRETDVQQPPGREEPLLLRLAVDLLEPRLDEADVRQPRQRALELAAQVAPGLEALLAARLVEEAEGREPDREVLLADGRGQFPHQLQHEPAALLDAAAVVVRPPVAVGIQELLGQVAVGAVQLDPVEPGLHGCLGRPAVVLDRLLDLGHGHFYGRVVRELDWRACVRDGIRETLLGIVPWHARRS